MLQEIDCSAEQPTCFISWAHALRSPKLPVGSIMSLGYVPKSCGTDCFIAATYAGLIFDAEVVDLDTHKTSSGQDFYQVNPKGNVPAFLTPKGLLSEAAAVLQFIADQAPESKLAPALGSFERYQLINTFNFINTEVQPLYADMFSPIWDVAAKEKFKDAIYSKLDCLEKLYIDRDPFLNSQQPTIATIYLYLVLTWSPCVGICLDRYHLVKQFMKDVGTNSKVRAAWNKMQAGSN